MRLWLTWIALALTFLQHQPTNAALAVHAASHASCKAENRNPSSNEKRVTPYTTNSVRPSDGKLRGTFHSDCGDGFKWVPPHRDAVKLGIANSSSG